jgi:hypothetical protein
LTFPTKSVAGHREKSASSRASRIFSVSFLNTGTYRHTARIETSSSGQKAYVHEFGPEFETPEGRTNRRMRVIFDNGTEINALLRSFQRALYKPENHGRRITEPSAGPLFADSADDADLASGTIYVLRSKSSHPLVAAHRDVVHKIGVTSGDIKRRIANASLDPTFLMADVEVVATYELFNISRTKFEALIHRVFDPARLVVEIMDRFGNPVVDAR